MWASWSAARAGVRQLAHPASRARLAVRDRWNVVLAPSFAPFAAVNDSMESETRTAGLVVSAPRVEISLCHHTDGYGSGIYLSRHRISD
jgi:hypothetical protein